MGPPDGTPQVNTTPTHGSKDVHVWRLCADAIAKLELESSAPVRDGAVSGDQSGWA